MVNLKYCGSKLRTYDMEAEENKEQNIYQTELLAWDKRTWEMSKSSNSQIVKKEEKETQEKESLEHVVWLNIIGLKYAK